MRGKNKGQLLKLFKFRILQAHKEALPKLLFFLDKFFCSQLKEFFPIKGDGRDQNNRYPSLPSPDEFQDMEAILNRHADIGDNAGGFNLG